MDVYRYNSRTGAFYGPGLIGIVWGYSGFGISRNQPEREDMAGEGPIPRGRYMIGPPHESKRVGPVAMRLHPVGHTAHGRSALMIHGDNRTHSASRGCVILPRTVREEIGRAVLSAPDPCYLDVFATSDRPDDPGSIA